MSQKFKTIDVLRLEIEDDPTGLVNLVQNPNGELGGWGWITPVANSNLVGETFNGYSTLLYESPGSVASYLTTEPMAIAATEYAAASMKFVGINGYIRVRFEWLKSDLTANGTSTQSGYSNTLATLKLGPYQAPANTAYMRLRIDHYSTNAGANPTAGQLIRFREVTVAKAATSAELTTGTSRTNLVSNPSFETNTTGWTATGTDPSISRQVGGQSGSYGLRLTKGTVENTVRTNLMRNPSFETNATGWSRSSSGGGSNTCARSTAQAYSGSASLLNSATATVSGQVGARFLTGTSAMPVTAGLGYRVQARVRMHSNFTADNSVRLIYRWYNSGGTLLSTFSHTMDSDIALNTWVLVDSATLVAPSGAAFLSIEINGVKVGGLVASGTTFYIDAVMVEQATITNAYFDGATPDAGGVDYAWTGTAHASTSTASTPISAANIGASTSVSVTQNLDYTVSAYLRSGSTLRNASVRLTWKNAGGTTLSSTVTSLGTLTTSYVRYSKTATAPSLATSLVVEFFIDSMIYGEYHWIDAVMVEQSSTLGSYIEGVVANVNLPYIDPAASYINVLGPTHDIKVNREAANIGTLEATILDATLDPSQDDLIRPGRRVRLMAHDSFEDDWVPLFTGRATEASVTYEVKDPDVPDQKRARITLTAVDATADLANTQRSEGVTTIDELPYVLEGCGVPWNVNGSGNQVPTATVVAVNENASALDQVAITRDTNLGYAWVDREGVLQVWDPTTIAKDGTPYISAAQITDLDKSYNTQDCINEVVIKFLRLNPSTGETEEVSYGPYRNETSISEWGVRSATFTIQGLSEETSDIPDLAATILASNADPVIRLNSVTCAVSDTWMLDRDSMLGDVMDFAFFDWYENGVYQWDTQFIASIEHSITPEKWIVKVGLLHPDVVASPQFTPSPQIGAGGKTIGQLLRPVGEVTMFYGSAIPAGWLKCDGSTFSANDYPELADLLGGTTLPNFTDRFPIGAGTKAVGTSGGDPTKTIGLANLPSHTHGSGTLTAASAGSHSHNLGLTSTNSSTGQTVRRGGPTGNIELWGSNGVEANGAHTHNVTGSTSSAGSGTALDVMNPWRAVNFIIRAV